MSSFKQTLTRNLLNIPGWRTKRKIVVIESDDWGSERMPSKSTYQFLKKKGIRVDLCPYSMFDSLASDMDLTLLYELLSSFKNRDGRGPVFTANFNLVNPDFEKIKKHDFNKYFYKTLIETLREYPQHSNVFDLLNEGIKQKIFVPQYHHREHLSPTLWLEQLINGNKALHCGFEAGVYALSRITSPEIKQFHLASLIYRNEAEKRVVENAISDGDKIFLKLFGYAPTSFIAPVYIWNSDLEAQLKEIGIKYIQGARFQNENLLNKADNFKRKIHFTGQRNKIGSIYTVRNCSFEPSLMPDIDCVSSCLEDINRAFRWHKPAIISSHRINYVGFLESSNRDKNLILLKELIEQIIKRYPDVEFLTSSELGNLIENKP